MDLGVLGYYRQMILRSSDVDERDVFYMLFEHVSTLRPSVSAFRPSLSAVSFSRSGEARLRTTYRYQQPRVLCSWRRFRTTG
jgi:hypothetical protein